MQALSRNTASVAQDFLNAGGDVEDHPPQLSLLEAITSKLQRYNNRMDSHSSDEEQFVLDGYQTAATHNRQRQCSPPASYPNKSIICDRRRRTTSTPSDSDQSQSSQSLSSPPPSSHNTSFRRASGQQIFDNLYQKSINSYVRQLQSSEHDEMFKAKLIEFLENNPDISISNIDLSQTGGVHQSVTEKRSHRKQTQPRKIEKIESFSKSALRDKHMERMVTQGLVCRLCKNRDLFGSYHTHASLILHQRWRHSQRRLRCATCGSQFNRKYKLILHKIVKKHNTKFH